MNQYYVDDFFQFAEHMMKSVLGEDFSIYYLYDIAKAISEGWNVAKGVRVEIPDSLSCFSKWRYCEENNISRKDWVGMYNWGITDHHRYLELKPWLNVNWYEVAQFLTNFASIENTFGDDWRICIEEDTIDDLISTLESNGFRPSIIRTVSDLVNEFGLT